MINKGKFNISREEILIFKENNFLKNINFVTIQIIANKTFMRNIITKKTYFTDWAKSLYRLLKSKLTNQTKPKVYKSL